MEKIVVVGSGIVGSSTAYQILRKMPNAHVTMIDAFGKAAQGASVQNGCIMTPEMGACWSYIPTSMIFKGLYSY